MLSQSAAFCFIAERRDPLEPFLRAFIPSAQTAWWCTNPNDALRFTATGRQQMEEAVRLGHGQPLKFRKVMST